MTAELILTADTPPALEKARAAAAPLAPAPALPRPDPARRIDRMWHAAQARATGGFSPLALPNAWLDWAGHLANAPGRQLALWHDAQQTALEAWSVFWGAEPAEPGPGDRRFADPRWREPPYRAWRQWFLLAEAALARATRDVPGVGADSERLIGFVTRQLLDTVAPSNLPWSNPEIVEASVASGGANLLQGWTKWLEDVARAAGPEPLPLAIGTDVAATPGAVVYRNALMELIQYAPTTPTVRAEPVLIVPAWIMKYYVLDLSPRNSLIRWLVGQGFTVFCISWRNPGAEFADTRFDDYRRLGVEAALAAVREICGDAPVHAAGYCLGGSILAATAAAHARDGRDALASLTLLAAQTEFSEPGELQLFITEDQLAFLEDVMAEQGYLDGRQMGGAFSLLRSRDLVWARLVRRYWLGEEERPNDLSAWNADTTRLPARMHSEYLRQLFLSDDLAEGRYLVDGRPVSLADLRLPIFAVGTETDHVAPWQSVHKIHMLTPAEITFVLTNGGHNAGIVSEPGHRNRRFRIATRKAGAAWSAPAEWAAAAPLCDGSWWPAWGDWLAARASPADRAPPPLGGAAGRTLDPAPGRYVLER